MSDLYKRLGLAKGATADEIKKSYRSLAKKYHPDLNPNDANVKKKFQEITEAYEILSNPEKRGQYDRGEIDESGTPRAPYGFSGFKGEAGARSPFQEEFHFSNSSFFGDDIFSSIFGQGGPKRTRAAQPQKGDDLHYTLKIPFLDACLGTKRHINLGDNRSVELAIPAGIEHGNKLRLKGKGKPGPHGGPEGDAFVEVHIADHPYFKREGHHILLTLPLSLPEAVLGAAVKVPTIHGPVNMRIPPSTSSGKLFRLKEKGIESKGKKGDQLVTTSLILPQNSDGELIHFLENWEKNHPYKVRDF